MNTYQCSDGTRIRKSIIDGRVRKAKAYKLEQQQIEYGYNFCEECHRNDCKPIDCSHVVSVDECQKSGRAELAYDPENITILGRRCHQQRDKLLVNYKP